MRQGELPPQRGRDYQPFRNAIAADVGQKVALENKAAGNEIPAGGKPDDLNASGNDAIENGNYALAVELSEQATKADPKHKCAWNNLEEPTQV